MESKICSQCEIDKPLSEYYKRRSKSDKPYDRCKKCFNQYCGNRWVDRKIEAIEYKGGKCEDCNLSYPDQPYVIFDFHHLDPSQKEFQWNKLRQKSLDSIKKELDKCVLLCSNCHRKRHHYD
jgi:hypothetical protein